MGLERLPIDEVLPELLAALCAGGVAVLQAPPGAGKTTRVPPAIADSDLGRRGKVLVLEPRRVAARAAARRIAVERDWTVGREVGWWIRFERRFRADTRIVFATEGMLVAWLQRDPFLEGVAAVVFDEFHERSLAADLALALVRRIRLEARPDLAVVVMSATLDPGPLSAFLGDAPVVASAGRLHPVETRLLERTDDRALELQVASAVRRALDETTGDLLVFLPGLAEIRRAQEALEQLSRERQLLVVPLHGDLAIESQDAALSRSTRRRVVLATNVAETSVTVEGVRAVVDSGLARQPRYDPASGLDRLETVRIARAAADQRAGRAGREAPGLCLRLWTAADDRALRPFELPEIRRVDLAGTVLELAAWGEPDPRTFEWFEAPELARLDRAIEELTEWGALDSNGLTALGRTLARLPLPPRLGRLVLEGERLGVEEGAALTAALLSERDPFRGDRDPTRRPGSRSDLLDRLDALDRRRHAKLFEAQHQILRLLDNTNPDPTPTPPSAEGATPSDEEPPRRKTSIEERNGAPTSPPPRRTAPPPNWKPLPLPLPSSLNKRPLSLSLSLPSPSAQAAGGDPDEPLLRAIAAAYLDRLCRRREPGGERAVMVGGRGVRLGRASAVRDAELFVAVELDAGRPGERSEGWVRVASAVERDWLPTDQVRSGRELVWDEGRLRVVARLVTRFADLVLDEREVPIEDSVAAAELLADRAALDLPRALPLDDPDVVQLRARLEFLAAALPELGLPIADDSLLRALLPQLATGRRSFEELRRAPLGESILGAMPWEQRRRLDADAPDRLEVPSGSRVRVDYSDVARPVLAARIQELFGLAETPRLAGGRVPVLLHLLAPSGRPQQVTHDLASFWATTYPIVRKELAHRYPKHAWPDDPTTARPERRPRRR